jgi:hypothetical protein
MTKLHITQCDDGTWMMSFETESGELRRITSHHLSYRHLIEDALESVETGKYPGATIIIEAPRPGGAEAAPAFEGIADESVRPEPRRAQI